MAKRQFCTGAGGPDGDHCCWVNGAVCDYLDIGVHPTRRFSCRLRTELGSWVKVHADPRYQPIQAAWDQTQTVASCGDWQPDPGICCRGNP